MTALPPLPDFVSYSAAIPNPAAAQAVASSLPPDAAADPIHDSCGAQGAHQSNSLDVRETKRPETDVGVAPDPRETDLLGSPIGNVGELFHFARMLCAEARIHPGTISPEAVAVAEEIRAYEETYDPPPLFLQRAGGWR